MSIFSTCSRCLSSWALVKSPSAFHWRMRRADWLTWLTGLETNLLPCKPGRPIMCSISIIPPVDWTANRPIALACNFTAYFISLLFISLFPKVHLLSLRQLSHDKGHSRVCIFSVRNSNFQATCFPAYDLNNIRFLNGIYTTFS